MSRARTLLCLVLVLAVLVAGSGCSSVGRMAYRTFNWAGETFSENPVSLFPFMLGLIVFFIAGLPLDLISWPVAAIAYDPAEKRNDSERYWFCAFSPSFFLGTSGGVLLGAIFYPFGWPWVPSDEEKGSWDERPAEEGPLPPPPGGSDPPKNAK